MSLTPRQRAFVAAYLIDSNGKKAAIAAGYSASGAAVEANRLLKKANVIAELARLRKPAAPAPEPLVPAPPSALAAVPALPIDGQTPGADGPPVPLMYSDPKAFLMAAMNDADTEPKLRVDAAKALMPFIHGKIGELGKKPAQGDAAKKVSSGRFAPGAPPTLTAVK